MLICHCSLAGTPACSSCSVYIGEYGRGPNTPYIYKPPLVDSPVNVGNIISCPECEFLQRTEVVVGEEKITMKGIEVSFFAKWYLCLKCKGLFCTAEMLDQNLESARESYKKIIRMV